MLLWVSKGRPEPEPEQVLSIISLMVVMVVVVWLLSSVMSGTASFGLGWMGLTPIGVDVSTSTRGNGFLRM
jgi:hypothetical protein